MTTNSILQARTPRMPWAVLATVALLCSTATFCLAGEVPKDLEHKEGTILFMNKLGQVVQLGRVCGLNDSELSGPAALYRAYLALADAEQRSRVLPAQEKQKLATQQDVTDAFLAGAQGILERGPIPPDACARGKLLTEKNNPGSVASARKIVELSAGIK